MSPLIRRRPVARLAVGAATAGVAYNAGKRRANQAPDAAGTTTDEAAPPSNYVPSPPAASAPPDTAAQLEKLAGLHASGALTDDEFAAAKAGVLGG